MTRIAFITQNLVFGGVQRVVVNLANRLAENNDVSVIFFEDKPMAFALDKRIRVHVLPEMKIDPSILAGRERSHTLKAGKDLYRRRVSLLKDALHEIDADIFISFEDYNNLIAIDSIKSGPDNRKLIVSSRVSINHQYKDSYVHLLDFDFYEAGIRQLYKKADAVVSVSEGVKNELQTLGVASQVIRNGVDRGEINRLTQEHVEIADYIVCAGRLHTRQKGQDDLIRAFARIHGSIDESLVVIGNGPDRNKLENLIADLDLQDRVKLIGFTGNPYKYIRNAKLFVFPSYYEGFPNILLEAMACGCACISYDFEPSSSEISGNGEYLKLVNRGDVEGLAEAMADFCIDPGKIEHYRKKSLERAEAFSLDGALQKWRELIDRHAAQAR